MLNADAGAIQFQMIVLHFLEDVPHRQERLRVVYFVKRIGRECFHHWSDFVEEPKTGQVAKSSSDIGVIIFMPWNQTERFDYR